MEKPKILVVENELTSGNTIKEPLDNLGYHITGITHSYTGAMKLIPEIMPDIALIDIKLSGKKSGIDLGQSILKNFYFPFVFMSGYSETKNIDNSIKTLADAYLTRPFKEKDLLICIENALSNFASKKTCTDRNPDGNNNDLNDAIFIKKDSFYTKVKIDNILFIRSEGNYLEIVTNDHKKFLIRSSIKHFLSCLPEKKFLRIHNSYVININYVTKINHLNVFVNDHMIPISRNRKNEILKRMSFFS
jgi:DNA-binding LytR/AlgR family response regulator